MITGRVTKHASARIDTCAHLSQTRLQTTREWKHRGAVGCQQANGVQITNLLRQRHVLQLLLEQKLRQLRSERCQQLRARHAVRRRDGAQTRHCSVTHDGHRTRQLHHRQNRQQ